MVTVGYKCHWGWLLTSGGQWLAPPPPFLMHPCPGVQPARIQTSVFVIQGGGVHVTVGLVKNNGTLGCGLRRRPVGWQPLLRQAIKWSHVEGDRVLPRPRVGEAPTPAPQSHCDGGGGGRQSSPSGGVARRSKSAPHMHVLVCVCSDVETVPIS